MAPKGKPMMVQYRALKDTYKDSILMFQVGGFYQMYYHDAELSSQVLKTRITARQVSRGLRIPMCGVPKGSVARHAETLARHGYRVVICSQQESGDGSGIIERSVSEIVEPEIEQIDLTEEWDSYLAFHTFESEKFPVHHNRRLDDRSPGAAGDIIEELHRLDLGNMTPIGALNLLYEWKKKYT